MNGQLLQSLRFLDPAHEKRFLADYRQAGLDVSAYACVAGAAMFVAFLWIALHSETYSNGAVVLRVFLIVFLMLAAWVFLRCREFSQRFYVWFAGVVYFVTLALTVAMPHLPSSGAPPVSHVASPAIVFGLFMLYAFLRLPLVVASAIGWAVGIGAGMLVPAVVGGNESMRGVVYLIFANLAGMGLCRSVEARERTLYRQRLELESARMDARERAAAAEEANREKTRLIAAISHDLRQPMAATVAYLDLTLARIGRGDLPKALENARSASSAAGALGQTLDHLLTTARYDGGHESISCQAMDVAELARSLRDSFSIQAGEKGISLRLRLPSRPVIVQTDSVSIHRVLTNIVANAIKFSSFGDRVLIGVRSIKGYCHIEVVDSGIGISDDDLPNIWKPFVQVNNAERNRERGLGLGLFLVRRIIDQLPGHEICAASILGRGSKFRVSMPSLPYVESVIALAKAEEQLEDIFAPHEELAGAYVMLIEDDFDARRALQQLMEEWGVFVVSATTADDALRVDADSDRLVEAIVCDYRLPGTESGVEAIGRVGRHLGYQPSAIVVTGESVVGDLRLKAPSGTVILQKPFRSNLLHKHLVSAVRQSRQADLG